MFKYFCPLRVYMYIFICISMIKMPNNYYYLNILIIVFPPLCWGQCFPLFMGFLFRYMQFENLVFQYGHALGLPWVRVCRISISCETMRVIMQFLRVQHQSTDKVLTRALVYRGKKNRNLDHCWNNGWLVNRFLLPVNIHNPIAVNRLTDPIVKL